MRAVSQADDCAAPEYLCLCVCVLFGFELFDSVMPCICTVYIKISIPYYVICIHLLPYLFQLEAFKLMSVI